MFHRLLAGYFDVDAVRASRTLAVTKPIDPESISSAASAVGLVRVGDAFRVGEDEILICDGYVDCPWLMPLVNRKSVEFMIQLHEEIDCMFVDLGHGEVVDTEDLRESLTLR